MAEQPTAEPPEITEKKQKKIEGMHRAFAEIVSAEKQKMVESIKPLENIIKTSPKTEFETNIHNYIRAMLDAREKYSAEIEHMETIIKEMDRSVPPSTKSLEEMNQFIEKCSKITSDLATKSFIIGKNAEDILDYTDRNKISSSSQKSLDDLEQILGGQPLSNYVSKPFQRVMQYQMTANEVNSNYQSYLEMDNNKNEETSEKISNIINTSKNVALQTNESKKDISTLKAGKGEFIPLKPEHPLHNQNDPKVIKKNLEENFKGYRVKHKQSSNNEHKFTVKIPNSRRKIEIVFSEKGISVKAKGIGLGRFTSKSLKGDEIYNLLNLINNAPKQSLENELSIAASTQVDSLSSREYESTISSPSAISRSETPEPDQKAGLELKHETVKIDEIPIERDIAKTATEEVILPEEHLAEEIIDTEMELTSELHEEVELPEVPIERAIAKDIEINELEQEYTPPEITVDTVDMGAELKSELVEPPTIKSTSLSPQQEGYDKPTLPEKIESKPKERIRHISLSEPQSIDDLSKPPPLPPLTFAQQKHNQSAAPLVKPQTFMTIDNQSLDSVKAAAAQNNFTVDAINDNEAKITLSDKSQIYVKNTDSGVEYSASQNQDINFKEVASLAANSSGNTVNISPTVDSAKKDALTAAIERHATYTDREVTINAGEQEPSAKAKLK